MQHNIHKSMLRSTPGRRDRILRGVRPSPSQAIGSDFAANKQRTNGNAEKQASLSRTICKAVAPCRFRARTRIFSMDVYLSLRPHSLFQGDLQTAVKRTGQASAEVPFLTRQIRLSYVLGRTVVAFEGGFVVLLICCSGYDAARGCTSIRK